MIIGSIGRGKERQEWIRFNVDKFSIYLINMAFYTIEMFPIKLLHSLVSRWGQHKIGEYF